MKTWLVVAADISELQGIMRRGRASPLRWKHTEVAAELTWKGDRLWIIANGPGPELVDKMLDVPRPDVEGVINTGFCGALDPTLQFGDIVAWGQGPASSTVPFRAGEIVSQDRVASTAAEKRELFGKTGALAVEMEAAAVKRAADRWGLPFYCWRVVSDTASEDLPLDFNRYRSRSGRFAKKRIAVSAILHPFTVLPKLMRLAANATLAGEKLGEFFESSTF